MHAPQWVADWLNTRIVVSFLSGAAVSAYTLYFRHWFARAAKRQSVANYLTHYFTKILEKFDVIENQLKFKDEHYNASHLRDCVEWLRELSESKARIETMELPDLEMDIKKKVDAAYATAFHLQNDLASPPPQPIFNPANPFQSLLTRSAGPGLFPFLTSSANLTELKRHLRRYTGPIFLQWIPRIQKQPKSVLSRR